MIVFISFYKVNDNLLYLIFYGYFYSIFHLCHSKLGLQTVPTHVLVDSSGKLVSVLARKQFPNRQAVEALVATSCERDEEGFCIPCTPSKGDAGKAL